MARKRNNKKEQPANRPEGINHFRLNRILTISILAIWAAIVAKNYFHYQPISFRFMDIPDLPLFLKRIFQTVCQSLIPISWMMAIIFISYRLGGKILSFFKVETDRMENILFSTGIGISVMIYLTLFAGFLGFLYPLYFKIAVLFLLAASLWKFKPGMDFSALDGHKYSINEIIIIFFACFIFLLNFLMAMMPENFYDAIVYHLSVPSLYILKHKIVPINYLMFSNSPLNINMLYTLSLLLSDEILAKFMHFFLTFVSAATIFAIGRRFYNITVGLLAALIYYSIPIVLSNSWGCGNDSGMTFFFALALFSFMLWVDKNKYDFFYLSAVFLGIALASKYIAVTLAASMTAVVFIHLIRCRESKHETVKKFFIFNLIIFAFILPYLAKNYFFTGNPVYPFLSKILGGDGLYDYAFTGTWALMSTPFSIFNFKFMDFLKSFWTLTISSSQPQNYIGPLLLSLSPFVFLFRNIEKKLFYILISFLMNYFFFWYTGTPLFRFLIPSFALLSIFLAYYSEKICKNPVFMFFFHFFIFSNIALSLNIAWGLKIFPYLCKDSDRDSFLAKGKISYPNPSYSAIKWINEKLPASSKILFSGENKTFYLKRDYITYSVESNLQPLMEYIKQAEDGKDLKEIIDKNKITHILINYREAVRVNPQYKTYYWNERDRKIFSEFWQKYIKLEYFKEGAYVYSVSERAARPEPNILEELEKRDWTTKSLCEVFGQNMMWNSLIDEYKNLLDYGYNVQPQLDALYKLSEQVSQKIR